MKKVRKITLGLALCSLFSLNAFAYPYIYHNEMLPEQIDQKVERISDSLDLTVDQQKALKKLIENRVASNNESNYLQKKLELKQLAISKQYDKSKISEFIQAKQKMKEARINEKLKFKNDIYTLLTADQRNKYLYKSLKKQAKLDLINEKRRQKLDLIKRHKIDEIELLTEEIESLSR